MKDNKTKIKNLLKDRDTFKRVLDKDKEDLERINAKRHTKNPFKKLSRAFVKAMLNGEINEYQNKFDKTEKKLKKLGWKPETKKPSSK